MLFFTGSLCAETHQGNIKKKIKVDSPAQCETKVDKTTSFDLSASFILWQPVQENMQIGVISDVTAVLDLANGYEVPLQKDFKPGFKIGFGVHFDYDNWDTTLEYTWFDAKESTSVALDPNNELVTLLPSWQIPSLLSPEYSAGTESWNLTMNLLDWNIGREYAVGKKLCFRPFMGMRIAFIKQTLNVDYLTQNANFVAIWPSTQISLSTNSWGLGPEIGLNMNWNLGLGFNLLGEGQWDILYTQYSLKNTQTSDTSSANVYTFNWGEMDTLRIHALLGLGLGWGKQVGNNHYLDLLCKYDFQVFFDQNMFRNTFSTFSLGKSTLPNGNLYIQGLTITGRFRF